MWKLNLAGILSSLCRLCTVAAAGGLVTALMGSPAVAGQPDLWLAVMEPVWRDIRGWPQSDFPALADASTASNVLKHAAVWQFTAKYAEKTKPDEMRPVVQHLQSTGVRIGLQGSPLLATQRCGLGVESFGYPDEILKTGRKLKAAGADIKFVTFDEPLYYGHFYRGRASAKSCMLPIDEVLDQVVQVEAAVRQEFPGVRIGDSEPFGLGDVPDQDWHAAVDAWLSGYKKRTGHEWEFLQADVVWTRPNWQAQFEPALTMVRARKIPLGVFYTGSVLDHSDAEWAATVMKHVHEMEDGLKVTPQQTIIASWTDRPRKLFPESDPDTMTGVAQTYLRLWQGKR